MVVAHTDCRMAVADEEVLHDAVRAAGATGTQHMTFRVAPDQEAALRADVDLARGTPNLERVRIGGFLYDVTTGRIRHIC
jgi:carbonic anhydrase